MEMLEDSARERYGLVRTGDELLLLAKGEELRAIEEGRAKELNPHFGGDLNSSDLHELLRMVKEEVQLDLTLAAVLEEVGKFLSSSGYENLEEADVTDEWFQEVLDMCAARHGLKRA